MKLFRCSQFSAFDSEYVILLFFYHKATSTSDFTCISLLALVCSLFALFVFFFLRPVEEEVTNAKTSKDEEGFKSKGPQLARKNSSKNLVSNFYIYTAAFSLE